MPSDGDKAPKAPVTEIRQLDVQEVSLVDRAANRRKFLVLKQEDVDMSDKQQPDVAALLEKMDEDTQQLVVKLFGEGADDEAVEEELKKAKLSPKAMAAVRTALRALNAVKDELPGNVMRMLASLGGYSYPGPEKAEDADADKAMHRTKDKDKMKKGEGDAADADGPAPGTKTEEGKPMVKADGTIDWDAVPENLRPVLKAQMAEQERLAKEAAELKKALAAERERIRKAEFIAKAEKEYAALPGTAEEVGMLLKEADEKLSEGNLALLEKVLKAANEAFEKAMGEAGAASSDDTSETATGKLEAIAKELAKKENITFEQAFTKALDMNPELAREAVRESGQTH